ncbi:unnamed protein product [Protopolystoma xenopodis]|uniref:Ig-like domain-containing protein n=1 Tax=Protopolystoma xenopodis TaxID=117903 RepID=A0A448X6I7_9PLAT|nr:unnamed protein product [Protopolystoma xenopodis]
MQRYSKVALSSREPRPVVVTCPAKIEVRRGASATLVCSISSEVQYTVVWYKNDKRLAGYSEENKKYR